MNYYDPSRPAFRMGPPDITPGVRRLLAFTVGLFVATQILELVVPGLRVSSEIHHSLGLVPRKAATQGHVWQFFTYLFVHGTMLHILFNMLFLWWFGTPLEKRWGTERFLKYYLGTGIGAGFVVTLLSFAVAPGNLDIPVVGASGAIFGLLAAYGVCFKDNIIYVMMIFPMKARYAVFLFGGMELLVLLEQGFRGMGTLAHVSGMVLGYVFLHFEGEDVGLIPRRPRRRGRLKLVVKEKPAEENRQRYMEDKIDPILDKISDSGMDSLSDRERETLRKFRRE